MRKKLKLIRPKAVRPDSPRKMEAAALEKRYARMSNHKGWEAHRTVSVTNLNEVTPTNPTYVEREKRIAKGEQEWIVAFQIRGGGSRKMVTAVWAKTDKMAKARVKNNHSGKGGKNAVLVRGVKPYSEVGAVERLMGRHLSKNERYRLVVTGELVEDSFLDFETSGPIHWGQIVTGRTSSGVPQPGQPYWVNPPNPLSVTP